MSAIRQNPYILDKVDLGDTNGIGVGLGLNVDQDAKRSRPSSSSSFHSTEQKDFEALQQTPKPPSTAHHESQSIDNQPSSSKSNSSSANLFLTLPPPPRPKRRSRHERKLSQSTDGEKEGDGDLDVQIEAALSFVSRHGMNTNMAQRDSIGSNSFRSRKRIQRNAGLMGTSSQETVRLRSDFRRALSRIAEQSEHGIENGKEYIQTSTNGRTGVGSVQASEDRSEGITAALAFHAASGHGSSINGESSKNGKPGLEGEHEEVHRLLRQARILSCEPLSSIVEHATPPSEAIKRAIQDPIGSANHQIQRNGINTSASTPEGALGRITLPPSLLDIDAEEEKQFSLNGVAIKDGNTLPENSIKSIPANINGTIDQKKDEDGQKTLVGQTSDPEALRAGLRFVLGCYDELSKRIQENTGLSNAIISSIANGKSFQPSLAASSRSDLSSMDERQTSSSASPDNSSNKLSRARLRSGSILRALSRGKPNFSFDSAKTVLGSPTMRFSSPSRTTQMTFDALPENVVGPSNRLGMADFVAWSPQEAPEKRIGSPDQRQRSASNATSTSSNRNSRYETQEGPNALKRQSSDQSQTSSMMAALKAAKEEAREAQSTKAKLMTEMEQMSEELFLQANEMVKVERIKSSALEKELESLKLAMSNVTTGGNAIKDPIDLIHSIEAGAQNDNEAMMMAAVAEASRECAEAEEEAEEWRKHCEELESRIAILEEALYNSMALLSQQEGLNGLADEEADQRDTVGHEKAGYPPIQDEDLDDIKERDSIDEAPSRNSLVIPQKAFSESTSSFYSAGDQSSIGLRTPEINTLSPTLSGPSNEKEKEEASAVDALGGEMENKIHQSEISEDDVKLEGKVVGPESIFGREGRNSAQLEAGSIHSTSSHQSSSSSSAERIAISPRSSGIASRRQSRQVSLPPRLPEPVSPLPNIPNESNWLPKVEQGNVDSNGGSLLSHPLSARLSVATTASRSSSNMKHENDLNQSNSREDIQRNKDDLQKQFIKSNGSENFRTEGIMTEPIEQLSRFEVYPQRNELNGIMPYRKESVTTASTASSPMLQTPPLITATMANSPYGEKISAAVSKRGSSIPVVQEEEIMDSQLEVSQSDKELLRYITKSNGTKGDLENGNGKNRISDNSLTPQGYSPSLNEANDCDRESHKTSRAPSYVAPSTKNSTRTSQSTKKKSHKNNILKNMPPTAPKGRKGANSIADEDGQLNGSIASLSLYSVASSPSIEGDLRRQSSMFDQEEKGIVHQSKIRDHYAKIHQTSPALHDEAKKKHSFARRKRFNQ